MIWVCYGLIVPSKPSWPKVFTAKFAETIKTETGEQKTNGAIFADNRSWRIDRDNGLYDRYCSLNGFEMLVDNPCRIYDIATSKYIFYPIDSYCCLCCDKNADPNCELYLDLPEKFEGVEMMNSKDHNVWSNQRTILYESANERFIYNHTEIGKSAKIFGRFENKLEKDVLELPYECKKKMVCPRKSFCGKISRRDL